MPASTQPADPTKAATNGSMSYGAALASVPPMKKDFLSILDLQPVQLERCLTLATRLKRERQLGTLAPTAHALAGMHVALLFEKPSLRTRSTFEIAVRELGGQIIEPLREVALGSRESTADVARNLERWVAGAIIRTYEQRRLVEFACATQRLHVVNALTNEEHPCQALADFLTLEEHWGSLPGRTIAFVGDSNNVATSLVQAGAMLGVSVNLASPEGFELPDRVIQQAIHLARHGAGIRRFHDPAQAVHGASAVYTDVWTSMGQEVEASSRKDVFDHYQVNAALMASAEPGALFLHCLPAHRGEEVTDEVIDSSVSVVFDQAENRLHAQKALLLMLFGS